jgi:hypothetical protein
MALPQERGMRGGPELTLTPRRPQLAMWTAVVHDAAIEPFCGGRPPLSGRTSFMPDAPHHPDRFSGHHGK